MAEPISTSIDQLARENEALRAKLAEAENKLAEAQDVIRAIQAGDVDAVVVSGPEGDQVFTLKGAEYAYRALIETMNEGAATIATDPETSQQSKSYLELATQELERVTHITKQTLAFNREDKTPTLIDLRTSIDSIVKLFAPRLQAREITVQKDYAEVECIRAGGGEIQQIISNLLSNSMDATPNRGKIWFRLSRSIGRNGSRLVRFTIADTGSGIPPERMKKIFEPFFTTKEIVGTGLGLWITKQIVEKHGATIRVRSKVGSGTIFSIAFPAAEGTKQAG